MLSRRSFIISCLGCIGIASYFYFDEPEVTMPPELEGKILVDLHAHPSKKNSEEDLTSLLSWGLLG